MTTDNTRDLCPACDGKRIVTTMIAEKKFGTVHVNASGYPAHPCDGGTPHQVSYETGRMVPRHRQCSICHGAGYVDSLRPVPAFASVPV